MTVSLVVPAPREGAERVRNWRWLRGRYLRLFPDWELVEGFDAGEPYSKGRHLAAATAEAAGDVLVVADADVLLAPAVLLDALAAIGGGAPWVVPYDPVYRLNEAATCAVVDGRWSPVPHELSLGHLERAVRRGPAGGGVVVVRASDYRRVGGIDPAFTVWGGEDISLGRALDTLAGPHVRLLAPAWHLAHPTLRPEDGRGSPDNELLAGRYRDAMGDADAMAGLV